MNAKRHGMEQMPVFELVQVQSLKEATSWPVEDFFFKRH